LEVKRLLGVSGSIDWDSLAVWYRNIVPSYLWSECKWREILIREGFTWQSFLKLMKYRTDDILLWVRGEIGWEELVERILRSLRGPLGDILRGRR